MLSQADGPSDENDRSREPLYGGFAGFAFVGLVLFTLYLSSPANHPARGASATAKESTIATAGLPLQVLTAEERAKLAEVDRRSSTPLAKNSTATSDTQPAERRAGEARSRISANSCTASTVIAGVVGRSARSIAPARCGCGWRGFRTRRKAHRPVPRRTRKARDALARAKSVRDLT